MDMELKALHVDKLDLLVQVIFLALEVDESKISFGEAKERALECSRDLISLYEMSIKGASCTKALGKESIVYRALMTCADREVSKMLESD